MKRPTNSQISAPVIAGHGNVEQIAIIIPPARRAWRSYKFASLDFSVFFFFIPPAVGETES